MYQFDAHKLDRHPDRVAAWKRGEPVGPITVEVSPTASCNQRCRFCAFDYRRQTAFMSKEELLLVARELATNVDWPVKGITWGGEGEPTLHKNLPEAMDLTKQWYVDNGLITNGLTKSLPLMLGSLTWIRFSINAISAPLYGTIHGTDPMNLTKVLKNLELVLDARSKRALPLTVGVQYLLFEDNAREIMDAASKFKAMGVDYFVVKPYSRHPRSEHPDEFDIDDADMGSLAASLGRLSTKEFHAELRVKSFLKRRHGKTYDHCLAAPFFHLITSDMTVWPCAQFVGDRTMALGSLAFQTWREFLYSYRRTTMLNYLGQIHETAGCRHPCRLDEHNAHLDQIAHPGGHDGFI